MEYTNTQILYKYRTFDLKYTLIDEELEYNAQSTEMPTSQSEYIKYMSGLSDNDVQVIRACYVDDVIGTWMVLLGIDLSLNTVFSIDRDVIDFTWTDVKHCVIFIWWLVESVSCKRNGCFLRHCKRER